MIKIQVRVDRFLWTLVITGMLFLVLSEFWMMLEKLIHGSVTNSLVDNIVSVPIIVSLWFNAKSIIRAIAKFGK